MDSGCWTEGPQHREASKSAKSAYYHRQSIKDVCAGWHYHFVQTTIALHDLHNAVHAAGGIAVVSHA